MLKTLQNSEHNYIEDITQRCYSSNLKLLSAWSALSFEDKVKILNSMNIFNKIPEQFFEKIFREDNDYIVYLAIKCLRGERRSEKNKSFMDRVDDFQSNHKNPLIKYFDIAESESPEEFFKESKEKRLAMIANRKYELIDGKKLYDIVVYGIENSKISEDEVYEIILEYVGNLDHFRRPDGISDLWKLAAKLPSNFHAAGLLCNHLPAEESWAPGPWLDYEQYIPDEVINNLDPKLLQYIFDREELKLSEPRKRLFFSEKKFPNDLLKALAAHNFDITYEEFYQLVKEKSEKLRCLEFSTGVRLVYSMAATFYSNEFGLPKDSSWESEHGFDPFSERGKALNYYHKKDEITEYLIFNLAKQAVSSHSSIVEDFKFLSDQIVKDDVWKTFMNFSKAFEGKSHYKNKLLENDNNLEYGLAPLGDDDLFALDYENNDENKIKGLTQLKLDHIWRLLSKFKENMDEIKDNWKESKSQIWVFFWCFIVIYGGYKLFAWIFG